MENLFKTKLNIKIGEGKETQFNHKYGIYQDGTTPTFRDADGSLWAISGHTHVGHIGVFKGTCMDDLKEMWPLKTMFKTGAAGEAFDSIRYPEGVLPRGSIWPFGLYICPNTHRFFAFFHNETGWNTGKTGYTVFEQSDGEPDFRHIGLMHSDDEGKTWYFDRWVITANEVCFSKYYNPDNINVIGQSSEIMTLGAGDFSIYVPEDEEFIYIIYGIIFCKPGETPWKGIFDEDAKKHFPNIKIFLARTRKRNDGTMGDFVKYYDGSFSEPGNLGKETPIAIGPSHARIFKLEKYNTYVLSYNPFDEEYKTENDFCKRTICLRTSTNLVDWSDEYEIPNFTGEHYCAFYPTDTKNSPYVVTDGLCLQTGDCGENVTRYEVTIEER